jgi:hypothetical protein
MAPAVLDFVICEAKAQNPSPTEVAWVKVGYEAIVWRATFGTSDIVQIRPVVATLVRVGLLDDFEEEGDTFTCRISGWREDVFLPLEAARKREERAGKKPGSGSSKPNPDDPPGSETTGDVQERPGSSLNPTQPNHVSSNEDTHTAGAGVESGGSGPSLTVVKSPPVKHRGKVVPAERLALAEAIVADFNAQAGTGYGTFKASGQPSANLGRVLSALVEYPDITAEIAQRMVAMQLADPYWTGRPDLGNVFGGQALEKNRERVRTATPGGQADSAWKAAVLK